jgi:hypothetical protein
MQLNIGGFFLQHRDRSIGAMFQNNSSATFIFYHKISATSMLFRPFSIHSPPPNRFLSRSRVCDKASQMIFVSEVGGGGASPAFPSAGRGLYDFTMLSLAGGDTHLWSGIECNCFISKQFFMSMSLPEHRSLTIAYASHNKDIQSPTCCHCERVFFTSEAIFHKLLKILHFKFLSSQLFKKTERSN